MSATHSLSILICSHRGPACMEQLIASLTAQAWQPSDEIVVVDNGIEPARADFLKNLLGAIPALSFQWIKEARLGLGYARFTGFQTCKGDWLVMLDDDNSMADGAVIELRKHLATHANLGGVCPRITAVWEAEPPEWVDRLAVRFLSVTESGQHGYPPLPRFWPAREPGSWRPPGGGMIIRQDVAKQFLQVCERDPIFLTLDRTGARVIGCQDEVIYNQVHVLGLASSFEPSIRIFHHLPKSRATMDYLGKVAFGGNQSYAILAKLESGFSAWMFLRQIRWAVARIIHNIFSGSAPFRLTFLEAMGTISGWMVRLPRYRNSDAFHE